MSAIAQEAPAAETHPQAPPPPIQVLSLMMGMWHAQIVGTAARLGVADLIASGVHDVDSLAHECGADPAALYRLLRASATLGIFFESAPRRFALTPLGECLRSNVPGSVRDLFVAEIAPGHWLPWGRLYEVVKSGKSVAGETLGGEVWEYYAKNPEEGHTFARGMGNLSAMVSQDVARLYDVSGFRTIVDVGGSQGVLLGALLALNSSARGILFDRKDVIDEARNAIAGGPLADRAELIAGDFFVEIPSGGDLYLLKSILHDWPDERCVDILKNLRRAAAPGSKLLIAEMLLPDAPQPSPVTFMDINMLVMLNGRERTASELASLLAAADFRVTRVIPTGGMFSLIEAE
jgi:hypothetical protein